MRTAVGLVALVALALPATAGAANCPTGALPRTQPDPRASGRPITFGIFPGAQAGAVAGPQQQAKPEDAGKTRAALAELRGGRRFAVHLYLSFTNGPDMSARIQEASDLTDRYRAQGLDVEYV